MHNDLFSGLDMGWGGGGLILWMINWCSCLCVLLYFVGFSVYFYGATSVESVIYKVALGMEQLIKDNGKASMFSGGVHLFTTLFLLLFWMNITGVLPFIYPLSIHVLILSGFSFPFWLMSVMLQFNFNWRSFISSQIHPSGINEYVTWVVMVFMIVSETVSILVRPITLCVRLSMSMFIGQILMKILSSFCVSILYPFSISLGGLLYMGLLGFLLLVEVCVGALQATIFTGLCILYISEVKLKVE